ncbi:MAG TPA: hypothetical protein VFO40_27110 [Chthoniobacterales bacterium]|nr:hypothetical protein [Chthoniobacterales bacterium]
MNPEDKAADIESEGGKPERINFSPTPEENQIIEALIKDAKELNFSMSRMQALRWLVEAGSKTYAEKKAAEPLVIAKISFPLTEFLALPAERRAGLLLVGRFVNETNWLYKLLVKAVQALPATSGSQLGVQEEEANLALTALLAMTLVGKIYEGWETMRGGRLKATIDALPMPPELKKLKTEVGQRLSGKLFLRIRQQAFHYSDSKKLADFSMLKNSLNDSEAHFYVTKADFRGDILFPMTTLHTLERLISLAHLAPQSSPASSRPPKRPLAAYKCVIDEIIKVANMYGTFTSDVLAALIGAGFSGRLSTKWITVSDAPRSENDQLRFFVHPPSDIEMLRDEAVA